MSCDDIKNPKCDHVTLQVRAKYMTLDPAANRYVKYIRNIRTIQVTSEPVCSVKRLEGDMHRLLWFALPMSAMRTILFSIANSLWDPVV